MVEGVLRRPQRCVAAWQGQDQGPMAAATSFPDIRYLDNWGTALVGIPISMGLLALEVH